jgi:hypothetical protein
MRRISSQTHAYSSERSIWMVAGSPNALNRRVGTPPARQFADMSPVTTLLAAMTELLPKENRRENEATVARPHPVTDPDGAV